MSKADNGEEDQQEKDDVSERCCDRNLALLAFLIFTVSFMVFWEAMKLYTVFTNDYFDEVYYIVLVLFAILLFVALVFLLHLLC